MCSDGKVKQYYARQKYWKIYETLLNIDGVTYALQTNPEKPWFIRDFGKTVLASQDGVACKFNRKEFEEMFDITHDSDSCGVFECFHCGHRSVIWDCDYDYGDLGYDGEGIVQMLHCENCGAHIEYMIDCGGDDE